MEIYKLLDRFELLYKHDERLADLRRAYIDQDLTSIFKLSTSSEDLRKAIMEENWHSIFRTIENKRIIGEAEDLRKAILEENIHSLFRLLPGTDDLRKAVVDKNIHSIFRLTNNKDLKGLVLNDNYYDLWRILENYTNSHFVYAFKTLLEKEIPFDEDCFSRGQLESKLWLIEELKKTSMSLGTVFLCAGWYGTLATMMFENNLDIIKIRSFDIDKSCPSIAEIFNKKWVVDDWKFKASVQDIHDINFNDEHVYRVYKSNGEEELLWDTPDTIINTSSEHINNFTEWYNRIPDGKMIVVQGNDYFEIKEHVNCSENLQEFSDKSPMTTVLYEGQLELPKYKRFMKIGFK
jgi:hypothetical protein